MLATRMGCPRASILRKMRSTRAAIRVAAFGTITHPLRNLVNIVDRASWQPMPRANRDNLVKPSIFRGTCFELRADAEVILARIDRLTARKALHHFGRPMAHALISHEYQLFIIRPQGHPHIREDDAISSNEHCIRPARENRAFEAWPF